MADLDATDGTAMRELAERLVQFETLGGDERPAQEWLEDRLEDLGFETYRWTPDPAVLATHPSFPPADDLDVADRPSVAGVLELGSPDAGPTLVLNAHVDVVPADASHWSTDPFAPTWVDREGDALASRAGERRTAEDGDRLVGRGAADMKSQLAACVFAARRLADDADGLDGRIVVESVVGEEEGGIGAAAAALENPYPFDRDAAIVTEPTDMRIVTATEGCLMKRLRLRGRPAHAARKWRGVDVLPRFERIRQAFVALEAERADRVTHPLYERFDDPWPVVVGRVEAGNWASNVAGQLVAEMRIGVAPGETVDAVEREFDARLDALVAEDDWLASHPPAFERFTVQFEPGEIDSDEPVVAALRDAMTDHGLADTAAYGETYGADARHYIAAGIPTVVFGPGRIEEAHFPDESIRWSDVVTAAEVLEGAARRFLRAGGRSRK